MRGAFEQGCVKARMQRVPCAIGGQTPENLLAHQRKISKKVEDGRARICKKCGQSVAPEV